MPFAGIVSYPRWVVPVKSSSRALAGALVFVLLASVGVAASDRSSAATLACPPGSRVVSVGDELREMTGETAPASGFVCAQPPKVPEPPAEVLQAEGMRASIQSAPDGRVPANALARALDRAEALEANVRRVPGATGRWSPYGKGPLIANDPRFDEVNGAGFVHLEAASTASPTTRSRTGSSRRSARGACGCHAI
ncbi:MAG TPA: hypothetical protein VHI71_12095 [Actinomycetota bacterium]|nr:hypothetical protein [Actinomycetota bacterium]